MNQYNGEMPIVSVRFTNGVGNNLFQHVYCRLLAEQYNYYYAHPQLLVLNEPDTIGGDSRISKLKNGFPTFEIDTSDKHSPDYHSFFKGLDGQNIRFKGYPEDFTLYNSVMAKIRAWHPCPPLLSQTDLVFHLRLGDRLLMAGAYKNDNILTAAEIDEVISRFSCDRLVVVTDMPYWKEINVKDVMEMKFHRAVLPEDRIDPMLSVQYFNMLYGCLQKYNPIVRTGYSPEEDFDYMRRYSQIIFQHGTLAWWAAALGNATRVAVLQRWRGAKNTNLGWTDLPGWERWGRHTAPIRQVKEYHLKKIAKDYRLKTFVETGTRGGATLQCMVPFCTKLHSVEVVKEAFERVKRRMAGEKKVHLYLGDSGKVLAKIIPKLNQPTLFWLDAHSETDNPILEELTVILDWYNAHPLSHVLVIDDLRCFGTHKAYPSMQDVESLVLKKVPSAKIDYKFDSFRIWLKG